MLTGALYELFWNLKIKSGSTVNYTELNFINIKAENIYRKYLI